MCPDCRPNPYPIPDFSPVVNTDNKEGKESDPAAVRDPVDELGVLVENKCGKCGVEYSEEDLDEVKRSNSLGFIIRMKIKYS